MLEADSAGRIADRMRANLKSAGIPILQGDVDRILELGLLRTAAAFDALAETISGAGVPDHLGGWGRADEAAPGDPVPAPGSPVARGGALPDTIDGLSARIRAREVSPVDLTARSLEQIAAQDPELNAFQLVLAERALAAARAAEREIAAGRHRGPLHGIPIAIKDLLDMAGTPTTAGSTFHGDRARDVDAGAVERLRSAGAIIVGKTRLAEFAYSPGSNNAHYGPTRNPHDPARDSGGSSSGSGAAVAAGMVVAALGSDTGGSIRIPASLCGIVGLKPTFGRVSLRGAVPLAWSLDHLGPMARTVADAALLLEVIAGPDEADPRTPGVPVPAYRAGIESGTRGLRVGVLGDDGEEEPLSALASCDAWRAGLRSLEAAGAVLVPVDLPVMASLRVLNGALLAMEAAVHHGATLRDRSADYGEFARLRLLAAHAYPPGAYIRAQQGRAECRRRFERECRGLDLLSTPTMPGAAPPLGVPAPTRFTAPFNLLGWPAITVPTGTADDMPIGLQLVGRPWEEATVLKAARVVEMARGAR